MLLVLTLVSICTLAPAQNISKRELKNATAFTKLFGYLRHFHPSDEASLTDWNGYAVYGMEQVLDDKTDDELVGTLNRLAWPIAPTVQVFPSNAPNSISHLKTTITSSERVPLLRDERSEERAGEPSSAKPSVGGGKSKTLEIASSHPALKPEPIPDLSIVTWHHKGVGNITVADFKTPYSSQRVFFPAPMGKRSESDPDPQNTYKATLCPGIECEVPLALYADSHGTLPIAEGSIPYKRQGLKDYSCDDRFVRLADIAITWNVIQHFYPYFEETKIDWEDALQEALEKAYVDQKHFDFINVLRRLMARTVDGHGHVNNADDPNTWQPPIKVVVIEDQPVVVAFGEGDPKGLTLGDVITKIDGVNAQKLMEERMGISLGATVQHKRYRVAYRFLLNGPKDSEVRIEAKHHDGSIRKVTLKRTADAAKMEEHRPKDFEEIKPGIYYINISNLKDADLQPHHEEIAKAKGVIYDFRGYPSLSPNALFTHIIDEPVMSAYMQTPIITKPDHKDLTYFTERWTNIKPQKPRYQGKIVYLLDGRAVSYAESCMGIVEAYKLGEIIGETSAGTNGNINPFQIPGGYTVIWTGMRVIKHDGSQLHGVGIHPTIPLKRTIKAVVEGRDEYLEKAIEVINSHLKTTTTSSKRVPLLRDERSKERAGEPSSAKPSVGGGKSNTFEIASNKPDGQQ